MLKIGLVINPFAGIGGRVGLKGSDGEQIKAEALSLGAKKLANIKAKLCFEQFETDFERLKVYTAKGEMGEQLCQTLDLNYSIIDSSGPNEYGEVKENTSSKDTKYLVSEFCKLSLDLIVFVGGDGTARDVFQSLIENQLVLGVPAGVKIHSGVYAVSPEAAGKIIQSILIGDMLGVQSADVVDLDEDEFRAGRVKTKYYGEMSVPSSQVYMQAVKSGSSTTKEQQENLDLIDIAADIVESMEDDTYYVIGSGTTCAAVMNELGLENTLLGSDIIHQETLITSDAVENDLLSLLENKSKVVFVMTVIGGQGHILGRGNHQISPAVIKKAGWKSFKIIATKSKLADLNGRPLQVDTGSTELDHQLFGLKQITTGYHDKMLYSVGFKS